MFFGCDKNGLSIPDQIGRKQKNILLACRVNILGPSDPYY